MQKILSITPKRQSLRPEGRIKSSQKLESRRVQPDGQPFPVLTIPCVGLARRGGERLGRKGPRLQACQGKSQSDQGDLPALILTALEGLLITGPPHCRASSL